MTESVGLRQKKFTASLNASAAARLSKIAVIVAPLR
jgi:hypothetical protein